MELADTSAWGKASRPGMEWFVKAVEDGEIVVCDVVAMELLTAARDMRDFAALEAALEACPWLRVEGADWDEARRIQGLLAEHGPLHHRAVKLPALLIAAVAIRYAMAIVHYDTDFDRIATVTGQPVRWAAPRGSL